MLLGVQHGDIHRPCQVVGNSKTAGGRNAAQAETTKGRPNRHTCSDHLLDILGVETDGKSVHASKRFEENTGVFEHRHCRHRTNVAETKGRRAIGD